MTILSLRHSAFVDGRRNALSFILVCLVLLGRFTDMAARLTPRRTTKRRARPDIRGAHQYAFERLQREIPPSLHYHELRHSHDDVLPAVERLAVLSGVSEHTLDLLRTAAIFHDLGYIHGRVDHEAASIAIVRTVLPRFGFSEDDIVQIIGMIEATRLPQTPRTLPEALLADADLDSLGREDFFERSEELRRENAAHGSIVSQQQWCEQQHQFLCEHTFHTAAARSLRDAQKLRNIAQLTKDMSNVEIGKSPGT